MAVLSTYKGVEVVEGATGAGGAALTNDFKELADRAPMKTAADPAATDDAEAGYFPGSLWLNTATKTMWICVDATADAAVWKSFYARSGAALTLVPEESTEAVLVNGELGVGTTAPKARLHATDSTIVGAGSAAVADGDLGTSQVNVWLDETTGAERLKFKAKLGGGAVKSGEVRLDGSDPLTTAVTISPASSARNTIVPASASAVPLTVKGAAGQSADLQQWQDSGGAVLASVSASGAIRATETFYCQSQFPGFWLDETGAGNISVYVVLDAGLLQFQRRDQGFGAYQAAPVFFNIGNSDHSSLTVNDSNVGVGTLAPGARLGVFGSVAATVGLAVKGAAGQTANLQEWRNSAGTRLASVSANGGFAPANMADASAANGTLYYSTTAGKLVFKDFAGVARALY